uniref:Protein kinase domain-containing protein n=1 Tax=Brassica oleracea var. oleracea TaxID=109376 RepID=A0A0D3DQR9_BRAOL
MKVQRLILVAVFFYLACMELVNGQPRKDCQTRCGNVTIEYPFGTSQGCYYADDPSFNLTCNDKEKLFFRNNIEVINISHSGELRVMTNTSYACYDSQGNSNGSRYYTYRLGSLSLSHKNKFNVVGCNAVALLSTFGPQNYSTGCLSACNFPPLANGDCNGAGCCRTDVSDPYDSYSFQTRSSRLQNMTSVYDFNPCTYAFLAENGTFHFDALEDLKNLRNVNEFPLVLDWSIGNQTCEQVGNRSICGMFNSTCFNSTRGTGYNCKCLEGFEGNPYLSNEHGCQDINECTTNSTIHKHNCSDPSTCRDKVGGFDCKCQSGYRLDTTTMKCKHKDFGWATILLVEIAGTLAYLHSSASIPIIHRDVKTANILLDENLTAKVADFGASRLIPMDKEQLTTMVQGTIGYLDPEYYHTGLLNEKSDVYSFGVVVMELLTGQKALCFERPQQSKHLVNYISSAMKENRLHEVIDAKIINENSWKEINEAVRVAMECTRVTGEERPLMTEVAAKLEGLRVTKAKHQWSDQYPGDETENLVGVGVLSAQGNTSSTGYDSIKNVASMQVAAGR